VRIFNRVADPFHFRPDPDPANQNFQTGSRILLKKTHFPVLHIFAWLMTKNKKMSPEVSTFRNFCSWKVFSCHEIWKLEKAQFSNNGVLQLYIDREGSGSGGKLRNPDPQPWFLSVSFSANISPSNCLCCTYITRLFANAVQEQYLPVAVPIYIYIFLYTKLSYLIIFILILNIFQKMH